MTQQIIDVGAAANDGTGEPLRNAFTAVNDNFTQIWASGPVGSQVQISGNVITTTVTNLGLTLAGNGIGNIQANSTIVPGTPSVYDLGASNNRFQYIYGDYLVGNGALITGIVANTSYSNSNVSAFLPTYTGNLVSLTGPVRTTANVIAGNIITSGFLGVAGNITGGTITGNNLISSGNVSAVGNITTAANISGNYIFGNGAFLTGISTSGVNANALVGDVLSSNVLYSSLKVVDDLLYLDVIGNVSTAGRFIGSGAGLTNIPAANISGQVANALVAGTVYTNAQPNITSLGTLTSLTATGNIAGNYFIGNGALLTGIPTSAVNANALVGDVLSSNVLYSSLKTVDDLLYLDVIGNITTAGTFVGSGAGLTNIPAGNITGAVANAVYAVRAGTVVANAQPNITSVGTLTGLSVGGNLLTTGLISSVGNIKTVGNISGNYFIGNGSLLTGITVSAGTAIVNGNSNVNVGANGNVTISASGVSNVAVFAPTGVNVQGLVSVSGNVYGNVILSDNYCYANGVPIPTGIIYTAATSPPGSPAVGDQWYDTSNDVLYEYINDGTTNYWVDTTSPAFAGGVVANVAISGTLVPVANVSYDIGTSTVYFRNTYTQNLYTNNRLPANNMPLGAVVRTVMSSSLGGSITNSTAYVDISYANVTITPSSTTSKVLVIATGTASFTSLTGQDVRADTQLVRSPSSSLQIQTCGTTVSGGGIGVTGSIAYSYIDSPGTTSAVTYKLQQKVSNASSTLTSTNIWLIAMEITAS